MKWFLPLMVLCVTLAVLKVALIALLVALGLILVYAFVTRPAGTLSFLGVLMLFSLASAQPTAFIITLGIVCVAAVVAGARRPRQRPLLLTDRRDAR